MMRSALRLTAAVAACVLAVSAVPRAAETTHYSMATVDRADQDPTCRACDDFYQFADGGWIKTHPIIPRYGVNSPWLELSERNQAGLRAAAEAAAADPAATGDERRIGTFFRVCMDEAKADAQGIAPLKPLLDSVAAITDPASLVAALPALQRSLAVVPSADLPRAPLFAIGSYADPRNSSNQIGAVIQSGIGLPDIAYYLDAKYATQRALETTFATKLFTLAGDAPDLAASEAATVIDLETSLAKISKSRADLLDPQKSFSPKNVLTQTQLSTLAPTLFGHGYFAALHLAPDVPILVTGSEYVSGLDKLLAEKPIAAWKQYLRYEVLSTNASALSSSFVDAGFALQGGLRGAKELQPRWQRCLGATDSAMGQPLGRVYVQKFFPASGKARALELVDQLTSVLHDDISTLPWMSEPTRKEALAKLTAMRRKIAYPDRWDDYSKLDVSEASFAANVIAAREFAFDRQLADAGKPTKRDAWGMTPQLINAQYDSTNNDITFPAAILLPFVGSTVDDAELYAGIGAVIGHEMTHGFDNSGRQFDAKGNFRDWWQPADAAAFDARAACIIHEFDGLDVVPGQKQIGKLVQGEAIADLGGLTIAYRAFERAERGKPHTSVDGYTPEQRFFLEYAKLWALNASPQALSVQGQSNEHPIDRNRVIGTLMNMPEFAAAFKCAKTDKMVAASACHIW